MPLHKFVLLRVGIAGKKWNMKRPSILFCAIGLIYIASGCLNNGIITQEATQQYSTSTMVVPSVITQSTITMTATNSPSTTPSATSTLVPLGPTPELTHEIADDLVFGGSSSECPLPCWHGLRGGVSNRNDIIDTFNEVFNIEGRFHSPSELVGESPIGYEPIGYIWRFENPSTQRSYVVGSIDVYALLNINTEKMDMLVFVMYTADTEYDPRTDAQRFIRQFGAPAEWLIFLERGGQAQGIHFILNSLMIFSNGISVLHFAEIPVRYIDTTTGGSEEPAFWCLADHLDSTVSLGPPFSGFGSMTPLQQWAFSNRGDFESIENVLNIDIADVVEQIQQDEDVCVQLNANNP